MRLQEALAAITEVLRIEDRLVLMLWHVIVNTAAAEAHVPRRAIIVIQDQTVATGVHLQEAVLHDILRVIEALRTGHLATELHHIVRQVTEVQEAISLQEVLPQEAVGIEAPEAVRVEVAATEALAAEVHLEAQVVSAGQVLVVDHMAVVVHQEDEVAVEETKLISTSCFV